MLVVAEADGLHFFDGKTGQSRGIVRGSPAPQNMLISPDGQTFIGSGYNGVVVWNRAGFVARVPNGFLGSFALSPDFKLMAVGAQDPKNIMVRNIKTGAYRFFVGHTDKVTYAAFSPDGKSLASLSFDHTLRIWDVATGKTRAQGSTDGKEFSSLSFSPDGNSIAAANNDDQLAVWDTTTGRTRATWAGFFDTVKNFAVNSDGKTMVAYTLALNLWNADTGALTATLLTAPGFNEYNTIEQMDFSPDGKLFAASDQQHPVKVWDTYTGELFHTLDDGNFERDTSIAFSPDSKTLALNGYHYSVDKSEPTQEVSLWDVPSGIKTGELVGGFDGVQSLAFSPDGGTLAVGYGNPPCYYSAEASKSPTDAAIRLWNVASGTLRATLLGNTIAVTRLAYSPDGKLLASAGHDGSVRLWNIATSETVHVLSTAYSSHNGSAYDGSAYSGCSVAFSPDGTVLVAAARDGLRIWEVASDKLLIWLKDVGDEEPFVVTFITFSRDGRILYASDGSGRVHLLGVPNSHF